VEINEPAHRTEQRPAKDIARQVIVISAFCFMILAALFAGGLFGAPIDEQQGGALDSDATYLAPAGPAFSIWSLIYVGLAAYTVWQALPSQRERERQRALGALIAGTMILNGLWLVAAKYTTLALTVIDIVLLLVLLGVTYHVSFVFPGRGLADSALIDGVTGLHLGWVAVATVANITAWLTQVLSPDLESAAGFWGVAVIAVVAVIGVAIAWRSEWRLAPGLAMGWGLAWIAVGRFSGEPQNTAIGIAAVAAAAVVVVTPLVGKVMHQVVGARNAEA
jgi:tryptophan-rich sensory protein